VPFKAILKELVESVPAASGAILADWEGEAVEQFCMYDDYEIKVTGAHKGIILNHLKDVHTSFPVGELEEAVIATGEQQVIVGAVGADYSLVMTLAREALLGLASYRFREAVKVLEKEIY
jgi:predicted regulator of Ras-like GTPase activity (Roadblock/LC7/MglB family)